MENQPLTPSMRALKPGASTVFISVWPVLKSLPQIGASFFFDSSMHRRQSTVRLGAPLANGTPFLQRRIGINLRGRDRRIVGFQGLFESASD